jgi:hypothetical protein
MKSDAPVTTSATLHEDEPSGRVSPPDEQMDISHHIPEEEEAYAEAEAE